MPACLVRIAAPAVGLAVAPELVLGALAIATFIAILPDEGYVTPPTIAAQADATRVLVRDGDPVGETGGDRAGKPFTPKVREMLRGPEGGPCRYCGRSTTRQPGPRQSQGEHVVPKAQGGSGGPGNGVRACQTCNGQKGNRTPEQWEPRWYDPK